ncbi:3-deoxy-D-manno-octulosonic acid transferase [uncultured Roseobacter sp.]|uniref:3-deoxy-D-manno-octulosonic acid transferase n=1 Tax=uncultured Roseobacter sp. TaxID=114847 RepID=UPI002633DED0|nr:3-deoxy-D-manno-octulosonic acid transferase [uncultured Roseobacter sp.]
MQTPLLFRLYVALTALLTPVVAWFEIRKLRRAGLPALRAHEKLGNASAPRMGSGPLIWFHAASVGESLSVLSLITSMGQMLPRAQFLITSGTPTSARLVAERLPPRSVHQFSPIDSAGPVRRFLAHWRPSAAIFVESELWPLMLRRTRARGTPMALVNARLSERSRRAWKKRPETAAYIFKVFDLILTQNDEMAGAMVEMNAPADRVARGINLKSLSDPLPVNPAVTAQVRSWLKGRPVWVAASTHRGEEETVLAAHSALLKQHPELLLILVPRHPERSEEVSGHISSAGLTAATRSANEKLVPSHNVYLADTLGELGSWYALTDIVFLGGSLLPIGGHNPFEVAQAGAAVLSGRHVTSFQETFSDMTSRGAAVYVENAEDLAGEIHMLLSNAPYRAQAVSASEDFVRGRSDHLDQIAKRLIRALGLEENT